NSPAEIGVPRLRGASVEGVKEAQLTARVTCFIFDHAEGKLSHVRSVIELNRATWIGAWPFIETGEHLRDEHERSLICRIQVCVIDLAFPPLCCCCRCCERVHAHVISAN